MKTVVICGCAKHSELEDDWFAANPPGDFTEVWRCNDQLPHPVKATRWFQLHGLETMRKAHGNKYFYWLSSLTIPVYMFYEQILKWHSFAKDVLCDDVELPLPKNATEYPVEEAIKIAGRKYHTSSFPYMVDLAIHMNFEQIVIMGIDYGNAQGDAWKVRRDIAELVDGGRIEGISKGFILDWLRGEGAGDETWAVPCFEFHLGIAQSRGIQIKIPDPERCGLFYDKWNGMYGLEAGGNE